VRIGAVILAAGGSTRLGSPKQLRHYRGEFLIRRAAAAALGAGAKPVIVVLGAEATLVGAALSGLEGARQVVNDEWMLGLASSLRCGLRSLTELNACDAALLMLADQPLVDDRALTKLLRAFDRPHRLVAAAYENTIGVPAMFGIEYLPELMRLSGDKGAGPWLRAHVHEVTAVPLEIAALDIDTFADVARIAKS
jgi:molybdenum cofactor cytidylyltransferase